MRLVVALAGLALSIVVWSGTATAGGLALAFNTGGTRINVSPNAAVVSRLQASGGVAPITYTLTSGSLPPGISFDSSGAFVGTSVLSGEYSFAAMATDAASVSSTTNFTLTVNMTAVAGTVQSLSFVAASTGLPVVFSLYLPPSYATSSRRFPVIYHLHGINGAHNGQQIVSVPQSLEAAVRAGLIEESIMVFPDGYGDSFWADSARSAKPAETHVIDELIPYIDNQYRTLARAEYRVIQGFSMGGFGAAKFATKFPDRFRTCMVYDGALLSWTQVQQRHAVQAAEIFDGSAARFDLYSPWSWLTTNAAPLQQASGFRDAAGALVAENRAWRDALAVAGQPQEYVETGVIHAIRPLLDAQGANAWAFIGQRLRAADNLYRDGFED